MQLQVQLWPLPQMEKVDQSCCSGGGNDNEWPHSTYTHTHTLTNRRSTC